VLVFLIIAGCNKEVTGDEKTASEYVKAQGYKISSYKGQVQTYTLDKSKLYGSTVSLPIQQMWSQQTVEPAQYFGKEITIYGFTVTNHPLNKTYKSKTNVYIMLSEGKVIGGYSFPNKDMVGWYFSLDGKTLEEATGLGFKEWSEKWKQRYGS
jgi:hypothetical protein